MESPVDDVNHKKIRANQRVKTKRYQGPSKRIDACRYAALRAREITAAAGLFEVPSDRVVGPTLFLEKILKFVLD